MTRLTYGATAVEIAVDPLRSGGRTRKLPQMRETASDGSVYVYGRARRAVRYRLVFGRLSDAELAALLTLYETTVKGVRHPFTWTDHEGTARTVRFAERSLSYRQTGPGRHRAEFDLEEELAL